MSTTGQWNGKRTDQLHMPTRLRFDENLANKIRQRAEDNCRTQQLELLYLIKLGIKYDEQLQGKK